MFAVTAACAGRVTPTGVGQHAAFYAVSKMGPRYSEFIYDVDQAVAGSERLLWHSLKETVAPSGDPVPPLEEDGFQPHGVSDEKVHQRPDEVLYREAWLLLKEGNLIQAFEKFTMLAELFPNSKLADNALYWAGECCYAREQLGEALHFFQRVIVEYPMGNKVPDAMLKMAYIYLHQGKRTAGMALLHQIVTDYPHHPAAVKALSRLSLEEQGIACN